MDAGRLVTRAELMEEYGLGRSTLEKWYRERAANGHPAAVGTVGRELAWNAGEWRAWYDSRGARPQDEATRDELAGRHGLSRHMMKKLWSERATNGHPEPVRRSGKALYWSAREWDAWYAALQDDTAPQDDELITLAEAGRLLGLAPSSVTVYAGRPPAGWPEPVAEQPLGGGRVRRLYRRSDITAYAASRSTP
jgi:predicted DNA-binding transcriptional regulator AlpA